MDEQSKIKKLLDCYSQLLKTKNKNLNQTTYVGLVEIFMKNGYLNHASYFLCQMDRLKMDIPRSLLDLFLDYSVNNKIFEATKEEITFKNTDYEDDKKMNKKHDNKFNKYDDANIESDEYAYYFRRRNHYKKRQDMQKLISSLKTDAKPFYPKKIEEQHLDTIRTKLSEIDPSKVKEYIPKTYKVVKKEESM